MGMGQGLKTGKGHGGVHLGLTDTTFWFIYKGYNCLSESFLFYRVFT